MNQFTSSADDTRLVAPIYLFFDGELVLDAAVGQVWHHLINYQSWQHYSGVQQIAGTSGREGEVVLLESEEGKSELPPYYARTVKIDRESRITWKVYVENGTQAIDWFGFVDLRVQDVEGKTRLCYHFVYEFQVPYRHDSELDAFRQNQYDKFSAVFVPMWPRLKRLVEGHA